jgi:hypothetical protein
VGVEIARINIVESGMVIVEIYYNSWDMGTNRLIKVEYDTKAIVSGTLFEWGGYEIQRWHYGSREIIKMVKPKETKRSKEMKGGRERDWWERRDDRMND